ncbi:MAG: putative Ig domain-containing protein [Acidobacteria bacterium]|nr:putative Ig domain-containing protein [Acidobacteriota bacterium]MBI3487309.1 putative Ig domain-containing protein [Acidobacteriota bacterium]
MRPQIYLPLALALTALAIGPVSCTSSSWCADCEHAVNILGLNYQPANTYTVGTAIPVNPPNPSGGTPKAYDIAAGSLPAGLDLDPVTGQITGTPAAPGVFTVTVRATNSANSATQTIQITVLPAAALGLSYATPQVFPAALAIAPQNPVLAQATPGIPTAYAITGGSLPTGLNLNADGTIGGTPATPGVFSFKVTATNGTRTATAFAAYTVTPAGSLGLAYDTPKTFTAGAAVPTQPATLSNAVPGLGSSFSLTAGSLPAGLSLGSTTGDITGTPTAPGLYAFTIVVAQGARTASTSANYTVLPAAALSLAYTTPQTFAVGTAIATQLPTLASETPGVPTTFALTGGALPVGLMLNADGSITGKPTTAGVSTFTVTATNGTRTATATPTYTVIPMAPQGAYQSVTTNVNLSLTLTPQNAGGPITAATLAQGPLPAGMVLNADGSLSGTPSVAGAFPFKVQLCNGTGCMTTAAAVITVNANGATPLKAAYADGNGLVGAPLTVPPTVTIGGPVTSATLQSGTLPAGMTLDSHGSIVGTPTAAGSSILLVTLANASGALETVPVTITVSASASVLAAAYPVGSGQVGVPLTVAPFLASGGPVATAVQLGGTLPPGMVLNSDGSITGAPTQAGSYSAQIRLCNAAGGCTTQTVQIDVNTAGGSALVAAYADAMGTLGAPLAVPPSIASGGPVTSSTLLSGSLPPGMTLNSNGSITGTPTQPGTYSLAVQLCNGAGGCTVQSVTITLRHAVPVVGPLSVTEALGATATLTPGNTGGPITSATVTAGGPLAAGLTLNSDGSVSQSGATPVGTYGPYTVSYCNTGGCANSTVTITVTLSAPTALNYATPVTYTSGLPIASNDPNPTGGTPTGYTIASGSLPAGLSLNPSTGVISGTPTVSGSFPVTISGTNGAGHADQTLNITVLAPLTGSLSANPGLVSVGQATALTALFSGGTGVVDQGFGPVSSGSSLPTGAYGSTGTYTYTLTVTNGAGASITRTATVTVVSAPANSITITVPTGGVTSTVHNPGAPLDGLSVVVPNQGVAVCADTLLTVTREMGASLPGSLGTGVVAVTDPWTFSSTVGYPFRVPMTVTLPYDAAGLGANDVPVPFHWDAAYGKWVAAGLKSIDTVNHRITFTTLLPGQYAVLAIPGLSGSLATQSLGFANGTDSWFQPNQGVFNIPGGAGLGMSAYAAWYFGFKKADNASAGLFTLLKEGDLNSVADDAKARALISRLGNGTVESWGQVWQQSGYALTNLQTGLALITGLRVSGQPQIFLMADARSTTGNAMTTLITGYNTGTGKFNVLDPNYPGMPLTIAWNSGTGAFTAYDRAAGYVPTFTQYAQEGQPSIHRMSDYERLFNGANEGWSNPPFATVAVSDVASTGAPSGGQASVPSAANVTVTGAVTNGDASASHIFWSQNGGSKTPVALSSGTFSFTIPALDDPYGTRIALETTGNPCDPTFSSTGYTEFMIKETGRTPWFPNICFESGAAAPWVLQTGSNSGIGYPASPAWSSATGEITNYGVTWSADATMSALVTPGSDANVPSIPRVYDGSYALRTNHVGNQYHVSRVTQTITVPGDVTWPKLSFYWAAVMQNAGHSADEQPFVDIIVEDVSNANERVFYKHFYANDPSYPGWIAGNGSGAAQWWGINWQQVNLTDLTGRKGHTLRIRVVGGDCNQGGHGGYAYLDGVNCN